jgi:serine/threonine protein kinase
LASGLLTEQQLDEARTGGRWSAGDASQPEAHLSERDLAGRLIEMGRLNPWQAKQLLEGRTKFNLGPYLIVDSIGQGGMGQVFKAEHNILGRVVAIKVLPLNKTTPDAVTNFTHEIRALASLDHPRLVRALDAGHDGNVYYLVTEYVPGSDLRKLVRRNGPLDMHTAAEIIFQVAEGLDYAHRQGLVHRDIKPGNVLVTPEGEAKLSDLGLAGPLEGNAENDPRHGKIVGTADYVSPDHLRSPWDPTPAWDIYSLGCTLYYAVTGKVPFPGGTTADKARAHCELRPLDPRRLNTALSDEFVDVIADMMAKDPAKRIRSAAEVMVGLAPWVGRSISPAASPDEGYPAERAGLPGTAPQTAGHPRSRSARAAPRRPTTKDRGDGSAAAGRHKRHSARPGDTEPDFPESVQPAPAGTNGPSPEAPTSDLVGWSHPAAAPTVEVDVGAPEQPLSILHPLVVFVLLPLVLVAAVVLIWWMVGTLWPA